MTAHVMYGIWIPKQGWLKVNNVCVAFDVEEIAKSTARRVGLGARVEFIDDALRDLEPYLLSLENNRKGIMERIKWLIWKN